MENNYYEMQNVNGGNVTGMSNLMGTQNNQMNVTSIDVLKTYSLGDIVRLPDFAKGKPFYARIKRPSLLKLVKSGKVPNTLLTTANKLFTSSFSDDDTENDSMLQKMFEVMDVICEASFVEPTYQQLRENGIELTDEQYMFIFNYSQKGSNELAPFSE